MPEAPADEESNQDEAVEEETVAVVVVEAKPKKKAAAVKKVLEPEPPPPPPSTEPVTKTQDLIKCQHCNKEMTTKSLKYSHSKNCLGLKKTIEKVSNEKVSKAPKPTPKQEEAPKKQAHSTEKADFVAPQPEEHPRVARMKAAKEKYNHLVKNAFNI